jgi:DNA primase
MDSKDLPARFLDENGHVDVDRLKSEISIAEIAGRVTALKRAGGEWKGLCPFHSEQTPSFYVNEAKQVFHCYGCAAGGDVIDLHRRLHNVDFRQACLELVGATGGGGGFSLRSQRGDPVLLAARRTIGVRRARELWAAGTIAGGTATDRYLTARGIGLSIPGSIRHASAPRWWDDDGREGGQEPAMLAAVQDRSGRLCGLVRTFLDSDGRKSRRGAARLSLGRIRSGAVRLGAVSETIMLAASVEDGLALRLMFPGATVWAAPGDGNLPHVAFPAAVRSVIVCGDADEPGRVAIKAAVDAYRGHGLESQPLLPKAGAKDFNEEWLLLHA